MLRVGRMFIVLVLAALILNACQPLPPLPEAAGLDKTPAALQDGSPFATANHNHLGETWIGDNNPLVITGAFGSPTSAALVLGNTSSSFYGDGLRVESANGSGVVVLEAGRNGVAVDSAGSIGVFVGEAGTWGVAVGTAGTDGVKVNSAGDAGLSVGWASNGVRVDSARYHGVFVGSAGQNGVRVDSAVRSGFDVWSAGGDGLSVWEAGESGVYVGSAGQNGVYVGQADDNGVEVSSAGTFGVLVGSTGYTGVRVDSAGYHGVDVHSAQKSGVVVGSAGGAGLWVNSADAYGVLVTSAGLDGVRVGSAGQNGVYVSEAGLAGVYVNSARYNGVHVRSADWFGVSVSEAGVTGVDVRSAGSIGVYADTDKSSGEWGFYTPDKIRGSDVTLSTLTLVAQVAGPDALTPGDLVTVAGVGDLLPDSHTPLAQVRLASGAGGDGVVGVVEGRMALTAMPEYEPREGENAQEPIMELRSAEGPAQDGDYVAITVFGVARVKVDAGAGAIEPGQRLTTAKVAGRARSVRTVEVQGITVAESAPEVGVALEGLASGQGEIWVLVQTR